jgi:nucleotide-binding universal stress UspA family protein
MGKYRRKILLAVDGSDQSFEAVRYVSQLFSPNQMEVVLFHVMSKIPETFWDIEKNPAFRHQLAPVAAWATQQQTAIQEFMERSKELLVDQGVSEKSVSIRMQEREAGIARDIIREAQENYDAVVVGRWGVSKLKDLVWGSIAGKLVGHLVHVPLWVVGGTPQAGKVLLAMDASEEAMRTVDYVGAMLAGTDGEVTLFHVMRGFEFLSAGYEGSFVTTGEIVGEEGIKGEFQRAEETMKGYFEEAIHRFEKAGLSPDCVSTKIVTGSASRAKAIVEEAKDGGYGTIVVGRRGLSRVEEFFMGRVSNKVVQLAKEMAVWVVS